MEELERDRAVVHTPSGSIGLCRHCMTMPPRLGVTACVTAVLGAILGVPLSLSGADLQPSLPGNRCRAAGNNHSWVARAWQTTCDCTWMAQWENGGHGAHPA